MAAEVSGVTQASDDPTRPYNPVFAFYVEERGEDIDLIGLIAYALYKRQKREWLIAYRDGHGDNPSPAETAALTGGYTTADARLTYRNRAADLLNGYGEALVDARRSSIREDALNSETLRRTEAIERSIAARSGLWPSVWSGIVATALWTLLVAILAAAVGPEFFRAVATALS